MVEERKTGRKTGKRWLVVIGFGLVVATVAVAIFLRRGSSSEEGRPVPAPTGMLTPATSNDGAGGTHPQPGEITLTLSPDRIDSAQIKTEVAIEQANTDATDPGSMRTTGIVQSNGYKETPVFPIAGGIVREVNTQLGDRVGRNQQLAVIFSTELADAEGEYLKKSAELEEHHKHHQRATELVELGAISREEFEQAVSNYKVAQAGVSSARERLTFLGVTPQQADALHSTSQVKSLISVPAPASGTIIHRTLNIGEVVDKGKELFRVADLSTVWVIGQVYESDFTKVRIGTNAVITTSAYPGRTFNGKVSYMDPRVDTNTRTAQVRVEVPNPHEMLKLGMFLDVSFGGAAIAGSSGKLVVVVPHSAVQTIGARQFVFVASDQPAVFIQREITAGPETNGLVPIHSGLKAGERVVTVGSFLLSAESLKLNPGQSTGAITQPASGLAQPRQQDTTPEQQASTLEQSGPAVQTAKVVLTRDGYKPATITLRKDILVRLTFVRQVQETCGTEISIPEYNIKRELPLNEPVVVEFTPNKAGEIAFLCGMNMLRGRLVVK